MDDVPETLPFDAAASDGLCPEPVNLLILIGQSHRPLQPGACIVDLGRFRRLVLGRGERQGLTSVDDKTARFDLEDPWISTNHARVARFRTPGQQWFILEDQGSKNGCLVNGERVTRHELRHGDIVETGQTFWRYYAAPVEGREALLGLAYTGGEVSPTSSVSPRLLHELSQLQRMAATAIPIILLGASGTGKEVMAGEIHGLSGRSGRLVAVNCPAIPATLFESELFGHRKGAFTGAGVDKRGLVEEADGGTLLLDEVGDLPPEAQAKVLRLLQDGSFIRLGETAARRCDVRFVAATNRDLERMVAEETFRGDLFSRLNGFSLHLPTLQERIEDVGLLLSVFLERVAGARGAAPELTKEVYRALLLHDWPFNIRELEKVVSTAAALAGGGRIAVAHLPRALQGAEVVADPGAEPPPRRPVQELDDDELRETLVQVLTAHGGNISAASRELGAARMQIHRWLKRFDLDPERFRR